MAATNPHTFEPHGTGCADRRGRGVASRQLRAGRPVLSRGGAVGCEVVVGIRGISLLLFARKRCEERRGSSAKRAGGRTEGLRRARCQRASAVPPGKAG